jgi:hypothetical protein
MDLDMTVDTATADDAGIAVRWNPRRAQILAREQLDRVVLDTELGMTLLAQKRR